MRTVKPVIMLLLAALAGAPLAAQDNETVPRREKDPPTAASGSWQLTASLVDAEANAAKRAATVQVDVQGIRLVDPASVDERPADGQGHIHYQLDGGPVVATTNTKLSFHDLTSGQHQITVMLAGNDHRPLGPQQTLAIDIP